MAKSKRIFDLYNRPPANLMIDILRTTQDRTELMKLEEYLDAIGKYKKGLVEFLKLHKQ